MNHEEIRHHDTRGNGYCGWCDPPRAPSRFNDFADGARDPARLQDHPGTAANAVDQALRFHGTTYEADQIKPGTTRRVTWTIPRKGTYKLACHIDHHYQMGMKTLITAATP
jgi:hypothetical protein